MRVYECRGSLVPGHAGAQGNADHGRMDDGANPGIEPVWDTIALVRHRTSGALEQEGEGEQSDEYTTRSG